jgi:hypothetical protein
MGDLWGAQVGVAVAQVSRGGAGGADGGSQVAQTARGRRKADSAPAGGDETGGAKVGREVQEGKPCSVR